MRLANLNCCGIKEFHGINDTAFSPKIVIKHLAQVHINNSYRINYAVLVMSHRLPYRAETSTRLRNLQRYVHKHKLGRVCIQKKIRNPNSGNYIVTAMWHVDYKAMSKFLRKATRTKRTATTFSPPEI